MIEQRRAFGRGAHGAVRVFEAEGDPPYRDGRFPWDDRRLFVEVEISLPGGRTWGWEGWVDRGEFERRRGGVVRHAGDVTIWDELAQLAFEEMVQDVQLRRGRRGPNGRA